MLDGFQAGLSWLTILRKPTLRKPTRSFGSTTRICVTLVMAYSEHDLSNLLVRLHVSIGFDDCVERKGFGDFRFEFSGVEAFVDVALGPRESLRSGHGGLR